VTLALIERFAGSIRFWACAWGTSDRNRPSATLIRAKSLMHGKTSAIEHTASACSPACRTRSPHSLPFAGRAARNAARLPGGQRLDADGEIMGCAISPCRSRGTVSSESIATETDTIAAQLLTRH